jgi:hypothetical protein
MTYTLPDLCSYYPSDFYSQCEAEYERKFKKHPSQNVDRVSKQTDTETKKIQTVFLGSLKIASKLCLAGASHSIISLSSNLLIGYALGIPDDSDACFCLNQAGKMQHVEFEHDEDVNQRLMNHASLFIMTYGVLKVVESVFTPKVPVINHAFCIKQNSKTVESAKKEWELLTAVHRQICEECKNLEVLKKLLEVELAITPGQCAFKWTENTAKIAQRYLAMFLCVKEGMFKGYSNKTTYSKQLLAESIPDVMHGYSSDERVNNRLTCLRNFILFDLINRRSVKVLQSNSMLRLFNQNILRELGDLKEEISPNRERIIEVLEVAKGIQKDNSAI